MKKNGEPRIAVLGCGPAGLLAAYAAEMANDEVIVEIYSAKKKSHIHGAQFLHAEIPGLDFINPKMVRVEYIGDAETYHKKLYNGADNIQTSWGKFEGEIEAWPMHRLYELLWEMFRNRIINVDLSHEVVRGLEATKFDLMINTIPRHILCGRPEVHDFEAQKFWIRDIIDPFADYDNLIEYNGTQIAPYARSSRLFGRAFREYGDHSARPADAQIAWKVVGHNCDCRPEWLHVGRFGKWQRGALVHEVYGEVYDAVQNL